MEELLATPLGWVLVLAGLALPVVLVRRRRRRPVGPALALVFGAALVVVLVAACPLVAGQATRALEKFGQRWPATPAWAMAAAPDAAGPGAAGPEAAGPEAAGPGATGSGATAPGAARPEATAPGATGPKGAGPDVIVVLTGGQRGREGPEPILNEASTDRTLAAVAAAARWPDAPIIITGGAAAGATRPTAELMARLARDLGVPAERLILETGALDTRENGTRTAPLLERLGARRIALVTSPDHMARARGVFAKLGYETLAVPATPITPEVWSLAQFVPDAGALARTTATVHEVIGLAVYRMRGWIGAADAPAGDAAGPRSAPVRDGARAASAEAGRALSATPAAAR